MKEQFVMMNLQLDDFMKYLLIPEYFFQSLDSVIVCFSLLVSVNKSKAKTCYTFQHSNEVVNSFDCCQEECERVLNSIFYDICTQRAI